MRTSLIGRSVHSGSLAVFVLAGCAATMKDVKPPPRSPVEKPKEDGKEVAAKAAMDEPTSASHVRANADGVDSGDMSPPLPDRVEAGTISREVLLRVIADGIPRFLQQVPVEPFRPSGKFQGWRVVGLFAGRPQVARGSVIQPGDVVVRVNRHSVERPEQFKTVWDSLAAGGEIVFDIVRGDQPSRVRYLIGDNSLGTASAPAPPIPQQ